MSAGVDRRGARRIITTPSASEICELAALDWLEVSAPEAEELRPAIAELLESVDELVAARPSFPARRAAIGREAGRVPTADENIFNSFTRVCEIKGTNGGALRGRPVGIKDNIDVAGVPTSNASATFSYIPTQDAVVVERILEAGGRIVGKLNMDDYASGATGETSVFGPPLNPHDISRSAGGSSGGSGSALASGEVEFALGGDQGGSARIPASYCGVVALKASHGLIPSHGMTHLGHTIDYVCPMARSVEDTAVLLGVIAGDDWRDPQWVRGAIPVDDYVDCLEGDDFTGWRIGVIAESTDVERCSESIVRNLDLTASHLRSHAATVETIAFPLWKHGARITQALLSHLASGIIRTDGAGRDHLGLLDLEKVSGFAAKRRAQGNFFPPYIKAWMIADRYLETHFASLSYGVLHNYRLVMRAEIDKLLEQFDFLLTPTTPTTAPRLLREDASPAEIVERVLGSAPYNTASLNLSGHPALAVPNGVDEQGMPTSAQVIGRRFDEGRVLRVGRVIEMNAAGKE